MTQIRLKSHMLSELDKYVSIQELIEPPTFNEGVAERSEERAINAMEALVALIDILVSKNVISRVELQPMSRQYGYDIVD